MKEICALLTSIVVVVGVLSSCASAQTPPQTSDRDYELFVCAMDVISNGPHFILITVVDGHSGIENQIAVENDALRYAIHHEYGIPLVGDGMGRIIRIAESSLDRRFTFYRDSALAYFKPVYTPDVLAEVRNRLSPLTNEQIIAELKQPAFINDSTTLHSIYMHAENEKAYLPATAHVLLERHILCRVTHWGGWLITVPDECPPAPSYKNH